MAVFAGRRINASRRAATLSRSGPVARNGLSLACNGCPLSRSFHSRVKVPGLLLRFLADRFHCPFGLSAPPPLPVRPGTGRFNASGPLPLPRPVRPAASPASTPLRDFYIPPDQSVQPDLLPAGPPSESARSPFAPRCRSLLLVAAADHRSRFATFPEACCSSNLLEPSSLCSRCALRSMHFWCGYEAISSVFIWSIFQ